MKHTNGKLWDRVGDRLARWSTKESLFKYGQQDSLSWIANRIRENGVIIADEVGLGKTRLALLVILATLEEGGNAVAVVPPGLLFQWRQEAEELSVSLRREFGNEGHEWEPLIIRSYSNLFDALNEDDHYPLANQRARRWVLLSQSFDLVPIRTNARTRHLELPALVRAHQSNNDGASGNDRWVQYRRRRNFHKIDFQSDRRNFNQDRAAAYLAKLSYSDEIELIFQHDELRPNLDGEDRAREESTNFFKADQPGRSLLVDLVGKLLGPLDIIVIDEAHKSREDDTDVSSRLGRILKNILQVGQSPRRVSMTATPIELSANNWKSLLKRTGIQESHPSWTRLSKAIDTFAAALHLAHQRPNHGNVLDDLILAAGDFEKELRPFVTRRLRIDQREMAQLLPAAVLGAHPHRKLQSHAIELETLSDAWRKMVLALEGQGLAAKGLTGLSQGQRQADIRYSSGLSCEFSLEIPEGKVLSRQEKRTFAWAKIQSQLAQTLSGSRKQWLWSHPRITAAANRIEELANINGINPTEKILVFGRFTDSMRALLGTLNARHVLRVLDLEATTFLPNFNEHFSPELLTYVYGEMSKSGSFSRRLAEKVCSKDSLMELVTETKSKYESERKFLSSYLNADRVDWLQSLPGGNALEALKIADPTLFADFIETLRAETFDVLLSRSVDLKSPSQKQISEIASEIWLEHLQSLLHEADEHNEKEIESYENRDKILSPTLAQELAAKLNHHAKAITPLQFQNYLKTGRRSEFCRILDGGVSQTSRRSIQASFNRAGIGPFVLIAQSLVGREGLNLHKACKKLFLFHPEWNPGVMEQQIGRVDRIESLWEKVAAEWKANGGADEFPKIDIEMLVFRGTYDEYQSVVLTGRRASLNAQLFGSLLDETTLAQVPDGYVEKLAKAAPGFGRRG